MVQLSKDLQAACSSQDQEFTVKRLKALLDAAKDRTLKQCYQPFTVPLQRLESMVQESNIPYDAIFVGDVLSEKVFFDAYQKLRGHERRRLQKYRQQVDPVRPPTAHERPDDDANMTTPAKSLDGTYNTPSGMATLKPVAPPDSIRARHEALMRDIQVQKEKKAHKVASSPAKPATREERIRMREQRHAETFAKHTEQVVEERGKLTALKEKHATERHQDLLRQSELEKRIAKLELQVMDLQHKNSELEQLNGEQMIRVSCRNSSLSLCHPSLIRWVRDRRS